jgi:hypothetical protein
MKRLTLIQVMALIAGLLLALALLVSCRSQAATIVEPSVPPPTIAPPEPQATQPPVTMRLQSQEASTDYGPHPDPFTPPATLDDISEPASSVWQTVLPGHVVDFYTYDHVRVRDHGQAILDLGDFMHLLLKRDTVLQLTSSDLTEKKWDEISVKVIAPPLQELVMSLHLLRGGFAGTLNPGSGPVALTTPNAVVIVSGTDFFVVYDPAEGRTWVGNFDGKIDVGDGPADEGLPLDARRLIAIPPFEGQRFFDMPPGLSMATFAHLVDYAGSPVAAVKVFTGLILVAEEDVTIYDEPSTSAVSLGRVAVGQVVTVLDHVAAPDGTYSEIRCPEFIARGERCWVVDEAKLTTGLDVRATPEQVPALDSDGDGWIDADDVCPQTAAGDRPDPFQRGCPVGDIDSDGVLNDVDLCPTTKTGPYGDPTRPGCPSGDADGDGIVDVIDWCPSQHAGSYPDPQRPGCPLRDSDGDGYFDYSDVCPNEPAGNNPDRQNPGCPLRDSDGDGWWDFEDKCRDEPAGNNPDRQNPGCPLRDSDGDGWWDFEDECRDEPAGEYPDPYRPGCPMDDSEVDSDGDGWRDFEDECPKEPAGEYPDPYRPGCPMDDSEVDSDGDGWRDFEDQCPYEPAGEYPDPERPGCPLYDSDVDSDEDGWWDYEDECPFEPAGEYPDPYRPGCPLHDNGVASAAVPALV